MFPEVLDIILHKGKVDFNGGIFKCEAAILLVESIDLCLISFSELLVLVVRFEGGFYHFHSLKQEIHPNWASELTFSDFYCTQHSRFLKYSITFSENIVPSAPKCSAASETE
jgi:hypothetical protein